MKQKLLLFAFTLLSTMLFSQAEQKAFEDFITTDGTQNFFYKNVVKTDGSGNIYVAGATMNAGTTDVLLTKKNSSGVTLWTQQLNGSANTHDFATAMVIDGSGNIYLTGAITNNTVTQLPDIMLLKYNSSGALQFNVSFDGPGNLYDAGSAIDLDGSGNVYITGAGYNGSFNTDAITLKFNSSGTLQWSQIFDYGLNDAAVKLNIEGSSVNVSGGIQTASTDYAMGILVYSTSSGSLTGSAITSTLSTTADLVTGMDKDASGNIYLTGAVPVTGHGLDYITVKFNSSLAVVWVATYNANNSDDISKAVKVDGSGNVYVTGFTTGTNGKDFTTIKYNSSGTQQWVKNYNNSIVNGDDEAADLVIDANNDIYVTGSVTDNLNGADYYTIKYDPSGSVIWEIQSDGIHTDDKATNMALDSLNNVVVTGQTLVSPGNYAYGTVKYVQKDVITPTDFNEETPNPNFMFYPNRGQLINVNDSLIPEIKYYTNNTSPAFLFKNKSQSFIFSKIDTIASTNDTLHRIDLNFNYCSEIAETYSMGEQVDGTLNYFLAHTGSNGITGVKGNLNLITTSLYNNIDLMCSSNENGVKYYFIVKPGGDVRDIQMEFTGASSYSLNGTTNALTINASIGSLTFKRPIAYQLTSANATLAVSGWTPDWTINGASNKFKFNDGAYTSSLTLVIEVNQGPNPAKVLHLGGPEWSTPFGGSGYDEAFDIKTDNDGNSYWIGTTNGSIPFYNLSPGLYTANEGNFDMFVAKFGSAWLSSANSSGYITNGDKLLWTTYYGGTGEDKGYAIAVNGNTASGDIYLTGYTKSSDFKIFTKPGYYNDSYSGNSDAFVIKLKYNSTNLINNQPTDVWATYLGGSGDDIGKDIKVNGSEIYIGGSTTSAPSVGASCSIPSDDGFPVCNAAFNSTQSGGIDGFIVNLNTSSGLTSATYIGGSSDDIINELSITSTGDKYFVGTTNSSHTSFSPVTLSGTSSYNQGVIGGGSDAFFGRTSSSGNWLSYYGGSGDDNGNTIALTNNNKFIIGGLTKSSTAACSTCTCAVPTTVGNFPICPKTGSTTYQSFKGGASDGFIAEFDINGSYTWGTYMGGDKDDYISSVSFGVDNSINYLFFAGETNTMNKNSLYYDISNASIYQFYISTTAVPLTNITDGYFGVYHMDNELLHSDYCVGNYSGSYSGTTITDMKSNVNKVHVSGSHYYFAGKTTNPNFLRRNGNGSDFTGNMGAYINSQTWPFSANDVLNPTGGVVNYNPDATMTRVNLHLMPMVGLKEFQENINSQSILIFPNPTADFLNVFCKFEFSDNVIIEIINLLGQTIYSETLSSRTEISTSINISSLANGVYNVSVKGNKFKANKLFIKQ